MGKISLAGPYPTNQVREVLSDFWDQTVNVEGTSDLGLCPTVALDSLTATEVLLNLEDILGLKGQELPHSLVKSGGYASKEEFIDHIEAGLSECIA